MEDVEIVLLGPGEWQVYRDLRLRALREEPQAFGSRYDDNASRPDSFWRERLEDAALEKVQWMVFAKVSGQVVGMASAFAEKVVDTAHVNAVYVVSEERGKGISKLLMHHLLEKIKKNPVIKKIIVDVNPQQEAAFRLYKNSGFEITKKYRLVLGDGKEHDVVQLEMNIR